MHFQGANVNVNAPGVAGNTFTVSDLEYIIPNISISAVVNAIASTSDLQTLSTPRILCMNNEEAKIIEVEILPIRKYQGIILEILQHHGNMLRPVLA